MPATIEPIAERHEYLEEPFHQNPAVHAQDAADDDASDEQVKEVGILGEFDDGLFNLRGQQLVIGKSGRNKSSEDRGGSDIAKHGRRLPISAQVKPPITKTAIMIDTRP